MLRDRGWCMSSPTHGGLEFSELSLVVKTVGNGIELLSLGYLEIISATYLQYVPQANIG